MNGHRKKFVAALTLSGSTVLVNVDKIVSIIVDLSKGEGKQEQFYFKVYCGHEALTYEFRDEFLERFLDEIGADKEDVV